MNDNGLLAELKSALLAAQEGERVYNEQRAEALALKAAWHARLKTVREIEEEIRTGASKRPLVDQVGTVQTSEPVATNGHAGYAQAELDNLLHASGNGDSIAGSRKRGRPRKHRPEKESTNA
jgi:hypothetical protein